jgi:hypothetical protein
MGTDYPLYLADVFAVIDSAEVITFGFATIPQWLLFDARHSEGEGPLLTLVPWATSPQERFKAIKRLRPRFRTPERVSAVRWQGSVRGLEESGAWERIVRRIGASGCSPEDGGAAAVLRELKIRERAETHNAILGAGYHSLWERSP